MKGSDLATLLFLAALAGSSFLLMRIASPVLGPVWLIECRVLLAGLALLPIAAYFNLWQEIQQNLSSLVFVGGINSAVPFSLLALATVSLPSGFTSVLNSAAPLFGTIIAAIWLREKLTCSRAIGLACGFAGVAILVGWKPIAATSEVWVAIAAGLSAPLMHAIAAPYVKQRLARVSPVAIATGTQLGAAVVLLPALPFTVPQQLPSATVMAAVLALALFPTALAYLLYFRLIQNIGPTKTLSVTYLVPLFAMVWGALVLQEPVTSSMLVGCIFVLLGTAIANELFSHLLASK